MEPYFYWRGVDSRTMGIIVTQIPPIVLPAERVTEAQIMGRSGSIVVTEGDDVFDAYYKPIGIANRHTVSYREIAAWLRGSGQLRLSSEPGFVYDARVIKEASASFQFRNSYDGSVAFLVQPLKSAYPPGEPIMIGDEPSGSATVTHHGDVAARPIYSIEGSGDMQLTVGTATEDGTGSLIQINLPVEANGCVIDTDAAIVTSLDGSLNLSEYASLYYNGFKGMWLPKGASTTITWNENITQVTIDPRWRWL